MNEYCNRSHGTANLNAVDRIPCPGCHTPLDAQITCCPICLRPRTKYEITRAYARLREEAARRRKQPFIVAGWLLLAVGAGYAFRQFRRPILGAIAAARAKASAFIDYSMDPRNLAPSVRTPPAPAPVPAPAVQSPPEPGPASQAAATARFPAVPGPGPSRVEDLRMPSINPTTQWTLYGRAYDLESLRPAANVQLVFQTGDAMGISETVVTDPLGRYAAALPRLQQGSASVLSADARYAPTVLCEPDIPYRELSAEDRRALAHGARDGDVRPAALTDPAGESALKRDLFLAPSRPR